MTTVSKQYSEQKLQEFKALLDEKLAVIDEKKEAFKKDQKRLKEHAVSTNLDFNENSKHFQQQAKNKQFIQRMKTKERDLHAALKRIEEGTYGICERTGELIREARLKAMPTARYDIAH